MTEYLMSTGMTSRDEAFTQAEASVTLGVQLRSRSFRFRPDVSEKSSLNVLIMQLRMIAKGAYWYRKERERNRLKEGL